MDRLYFQHPMSIGSRLMLAEQMMQCLQCA